MTTYEVGKLQIDIAFPAAEFNETKDDLIRYLERQFLKKLTDTEKDMAIKIYETLYLIEPMRGNPKYHNRTFNAIVYCMVYPKLSTCLMRYNDLCKERRSE